MIALIKAYLIENQFAKIPQLGSFSIQYKEAGIHPILHTFTPPGNYVQFTPDPQETDMDFVNYVARKENCDVESARKKIAEWVETLHQSLQTEKKYEMGSLGTFTQGVINPEFTPALDPDISPKSFALPEFTLQQPNRTEEKAEPKEQPDGTGKAAADNSIRIEKAVTGSIPTETTEPETVEKEVTTEISSTTDDSEIAETEEYPRSKRHVGRKIFYTLCILFLLCVIAIGVYAFLRPADFESKKEQCIAQIQNFIHPKEAVATPPEETQPVEIETETALLADSTETIGEADSLLESNPAEEAHCYVIIGGFSKNSNADNLVLKLQSQYPEMKNLGLNEKGTLYMVGAGPYTEQEAENQKEILSATYNDCWILTK